MTAIHNRGKALMACFMVLVAMTAAGCGDPEAMIESTVENLVEAENASIEAAAGETSTGEQQSDITPATLPGGEWPEEMPDYVPELPGDITDVLALNPEPEAVNYTISYENVTGITADEYEAELISLGWSIDMMMPMEGEWIIQASRDQVAAIIVTVSADNSAVMNVSLF